MGRHAQGGSPQDPVPESRSPADEVPRAALLWLLQVMQLDFPDLPPMGPRRDDEPRRGGDARAPSDADVPPPAADPPA